MKSKQRLMDDIKRLTEAVAVMEEYDGYCERCWRIFKPNPKRPTELPRCFC